MPITLKCGCGKHLKVRDELAGKRARCPGCGTILPVPSGITPQALVRQKLAPAEEEVEEPVVPRAKRASSRREEDDDYDNVRQKRMKASDEDEPDEVDEQDDEPRRRRKKKKKRTKSVLFTPLLTLFGIDMTPLKLMIVGVVFLMAGFFTFMYFSGAEAKVQVVDIYDLEEDLSEFCAGRPQMDVIMSFLFHKQIPRPFVLQENSKGTFLKVQFKLSERDLKKLVGERYENFVMKGKDCVLQADGSEPVHPLFIYEPDKNTPNVTVKVKSMVEEEMEKDGLGGLAGKGDKGDDAGPPFEAHNKLIAPTAENPWTHEGVLKVDPSSKSTFQGVRGMIVTFDHGPLPSKEVKITWNEKCKFWYAVKEEEVPSEVFLYAWRITCLFPKPESTKNLKLTVLGRQMKMDYP